MCPFFRKKKIQNAMFFFVFEHTTIKLEKPWRKRISKECYEGKNYINEKKARSYINIINSLRLFYHKKCIVVWTWKFAELINTEAHIQRIYTAPCITYPRGRFYTSRFTKATRRPLCYTKRERKRERENASFFFATMTHLKHKQGEFVSRRVFFFLIRDMRERLI